METYLELRHEPCIGLGLWSTSLNKVERLMACHTARPHQVRSDDLREGKVARKKRKEKKKKTKKRKNEKRGEK